MDKPIQAGDLVQVIRSCCDHRLGLIAEVERIERPLILVCRPCRSRVGVGQVAAIFAGESWPLSWLKRIPPLSEIEGEKRDEKLTEPA